MIRLSEDPATCVHYGLVSLTSAVGYGKTAVVLKFIEDFGEHFKEHLWVNAFTVNDLMHSYAKLGRPLSYIDNNASKYFKSFYTTLTYHIKVYSIFKANGHYVETNCAFFCIKNITNAEMWA